MIARLITVYGTLVLIALGANLATAQPLPTPRRGPGTGQFGPVTAAIVTGTQFTDSKVTAGTAYNYRVVAFRPDRHYGASAPVSITTRPAVNPTNFRAIATGSTIILTWDAMPEAGFYWFGSGPGGVVGQKITGTSRIVTNVSPGTYTYALLAYYGAGGEAQQL